MDWALAIRRNRDVLLAVVASIVALLGGHDAGPIVRRLRSAALALLRPAESAARRLIVIAAQGLSVTPSHPRPPVFARAAAVAAAGGERAPAFALFDRPKRYAPALRPAQPLGVPRIRTFWTTTPVAIATPAPPPVAARPDPDAPVDVARLRLRLRALEAALADLPRQARRLARWRARRDAGRAARPHAPLRFGRPPGHRRRPSREVDRVLRECHALALDAQAADRRPPNTS